MIAFVMGEFSCKY